MEDWYAALKAKGNGESHANLFRFRAKALADGCGFINYIDLDCAKVRAALTKLREEKKREDGSVETKGISARTANFYLQALKSFATWMVKERRAVENPLLSIEPINDKTVRRDARHERRALTAIELRALLTAAMCAPTRYGMTGIERALVYRLAVETGLRASELRILTRQSFEFGERGARVNVRPEDDEERQGRRNSPACGNGRAAGRALRKQTAGSTRVHATEGVGLR